MMRVQQLTSPIAGLQVGPQQTGMVPLQVGTVPAQQAGLDITSIMNMMIMLIVVVMMMKMMTKATEGV